MDASPIDTNDFLKKAKQIKEKGGGIILIETYNCFEVTQGFCNG